MKKCFIILLFIIGCTPINSHPPVIKSKEFKENDGTKCDFWYQTCPSCDWHNFEEDCSMYRLGDTISVMKTKVVYTCPVIVIARDSEGRILVNRNIGFITGTNYQVGDTIR